MAEAERDLTQGISETFVQARATALTELWGTRNLRMNDYEKLYLLDVWDEEPDPDERRIALPTCFTTVEDARTLLLTKAPVIEVPVSEVKDIEEKRAESIEKFLIAAWHMLDVVVALRDAEWYATCLGEGVLRCVHIPDDAAIEGELPMLVTALDPREVFATPGARPGQDSEVVHTLERTRREILEEWGFVPGQAEGHEEYEAFLDQEVTYIDYWRTDVQTVTITVEEQQAEEAERSLAQRLRDEPADVLTVAATDRMWDDVAQRNPEAVDRLGLGTIMEESARDLKPLTVRRRVVINAVLAGGEWVAEPAVVAGYKRVPFVRYSGIGTPLPGPNGALSVLFPITGGVRKFKSIGLSAAEAEAMALRHRLIEIHANPALLTDDPNLAAEGIDASPGAMQEIGSDKKIQYLVAPGPHPAVDKQLAALQSLIEDATLPAVMRGRYVGDISGVALSLLTNPVLMRVASRQESRERAFRVLNELILGITEEYAPVEGWEVWGLDEATGAFETRLRPDDIGGYTRNLVKLSASLPKDEAGELMTMAKLVNDKLLSRESFLDRMQQTMRMTTQSPWDELKRILRDAMLFNPELVDKIAPLLLSDYGGELGAIVDEWAAQQAQPQQPPGGPGGPGGPPGMPPGGMPPGGPPGMPPGPPQPQAAMAGGSGQPMNPQQMMAMLSARMGGAPPGPGGPQMRPPGPPVPRL